MRVGIPTEIKVQEFRVGITPAGVHALKEAGHTVLVQKGAGLGSMITDEEYVAAGAQMVATAKECWDCDMVVKVKEPLAPEYDLFHEGLILYTYLHLAPEPALTKALEKKVIGIAYETVQFDNGFLPLLAPMSEVAGRMATQVGAHADQDRRRHGPPDGRHRWRAGRSRRYPRRRYRGSLRRQGCHGHGRSRDHP